MKKRILCVTAALVMAMSSAAFAKGETKTETVNEHNNLTVTARGNGDVTNDDKGDSAYLGLTAYDAAIIQYYAETGKAVGTDDITKGDINGIHTKAAGAVDAADAQMVLNMVRKPVELDTTNKARVLTAALNSEVPTLSLGEGYSDTTTLIAAIDALLDENKEYITGENALLKAKGINPLKKINDYLRDTKFPVTSLPDGFDLDDLGYTPKELVGLLGKDTFDLDFNSFTDEQLVDLYNNNKDYIINEIKKMDLDGATIRQLIQYTGTNSFSFNVDDLTDDQLKTLYDNNKDAILEQVKAKDFDAATIKQIMTLAGKTKVTIKLSEVDDNILLKAYDENKDSILEAVKQNESIDATTIKSLLTLANITSIKVAPADMEDAELVDAYKKNRSTILDTVKGMDLEVSQIRTILELAEVEIPAYYTDDMVKAMYEQAKNEIYDSLSTKDDIEAEKLRTLVAMSGLKEFEITLDEMEDARLTNLYKNNVDTVIQAVKAADLDATTLRQIIALSGIDEVEVDLNTLSDELVESAYNENKDAVFTIIKGEDLTGAQIREIVKLTGQEKFDIDLSMLSDADLKKYYDNNQDLVLQIVKNTTFTVDDAPTLRKIIELSGKTTFTVNLADLTEDQINAIYEANKDKLIDMVGDLDLEFGFSDEGGWAVLTWALQPALDLNPEVGAVNMAKLFEIVKKSNNTADADRITYDDLKTFEGLVKETFTTAVLTGASDEQIRDAFNNTKERVLSILNTKTDTSAIEKANAITAKNIKTDGAEEKVAAIDGSVGYSASVDDIVDAVLDNKLYLYETKTIGDVTGVFGTWVGMNKSFSGKNLSSKVEIYSEATYDALKK